jgi:predicted branched-subunit amino acid permease
LTTGTRAPPRDEVRAAYRDGVRDMLPTIPALTAWGLVTGVAMAQSGLGLPRAFALSALAYAGSAQLAALPLLVAGAPVGVTILAALMVNLRFVIYSAALTPYFRSLPARQRFLLGYLIGDISFVVYMRRQARDGVLPAGPAYFLALSLANFVLWHAASFVGLSAAAAIPHEWGLEFAGLLALLALLVPMLTSRPALAGSAVAAALSLALDALPFRLGLVTAILAGIAVAVAVDKLRRARP